MNILSRLMWMLLIHQRHWLLLHPQVGLRVGRLEPVLAEQRPVRRELLAGHLERLCPVLRGVLVVLALVLHDLGLELGDLAGDEGAALSLHLLRGTVRRIR